ncbi:MAG: hypothetical protein FWH47_01575 [Methanomassiliicoccaceae archaeon]|nr:hypothetical protein [Methanomassiliicoccaceae archaeon]
MNITIKQGPVDERIDTRVLEVNLAGKTVITPSKSIEKIMPKGMINEYAPQFSIKALDKYMDWSRGSRGGSPSRPANKLCSLNENIVESAINIMIPTYLDADIDARERETMELLQHENTDIVVIPRWEGIIKDKGQRTVEEIMIQTQKYIDEVNSSNEKPIFGNLPLVLSLNEMKRLMEFYYDFGITSFVVDYCNHAAHTSAPNVRYIKKKLKNDGFIEESVMYSVNVRKVAPAGVSYMPADDFLVFGQGIDIIGNLHIGGGNEEKPDFPTAPIFRSETYTYDRERIEESQRSRKKATNHVKQNMEAEKIVSVIRENGSAYEFLNGKVGAQPIEKLIDPGSTPTFLDDFF